jgi:ribosomal protein L9
LSKFFYSVQELEKDCSELTEQNLELIYKLKESGRTNGQVQYEEHTSRIHELDKKLRKKEMSNPAESHRMCADLELKLRWAAVRRTGLPWEERGGL